MFERMCLIMLANLIFFYKTKKYFYCSDDLPIFRNPPPIKNKFHKRFLQLIAYIRNNPQEDHAITTVLNGLVGIFIYLALGANDVSFLTAFLVCFNPANNQCSVWVSGRWYILVTILLMLSFLFPYFAPVFLLLASVHPAGWFSPLGFLGSTKWWLIFIVPFTLYYQLKTIKFMVKRKRDMEAVNEDKKIDINRFIVALKTYGFYFTLLLIPFRLTFYHSFMHSMAGNEIMRKRAYKIDKWFYFGLIPIAFLIYSLWNWTPIAWGVLWYSICIAPYTNFYRCQQEIAERYCFIASVGLMFALSNLIINHPIIITAFLVGYMVRLWYYMDAFTDDYWLIEKCVNEDTGAWYAWHVRALKRFDQGCVREAFNMWVMANLISPKEFKILSNIGVVLKIIKKDAEAEQFFQKAEANIIPGQEEMAKGILKAAREGKHPICT